MDSPHQSVPLWQIILSSHDTIFMPAPRSSPWRRLSLLQLLALGFCYPAYRGRRNLVALHHWLALAGHPSCRTAFGFCYLLGCALSLLQLLALGFCPQNCSPWPALLQLFLLVLDTGRPLQPLRFMLHLHVLARTGSRDGVSVMLQPIPRSFAAAQANIDRSRVNAGHCIHCALLAG